MAEHPDNLVELGISSTMTPQQILEFFVRNPPKQMVIAALDEKEDFIFMHGQALPQERVLWLIEMARLKAMRVL